MRHNRLIAAAAGAAFAATALVGCSGDDLDKAAEDAKNAAQDKGSEMASDAKEKGEDAAADAKKKGEDAAADAKKKGEDAAADAKKKGEDALGGGGAGTATVDLGEFKDDANAKAAAEYYAKRYEAAAGSAEVSELEALTTPERFEIVKKYVEQSQPGDAFTVTVVGVEGDTVDVCFGAEGSTPGTATLEGGKVAGNTGGDHTC